MAEDHSLPGWPKKKLVKDVRRHLWHYGIRPVRFDMWRATWAWADKIARSYWRTHWPLPSEIGTSRPKSLLCFPSCSNPRSWPSLTTPGRRIAGDRSGHALRI